MIGHEAAAFLGVSQQTVYLWVEERRIPHLRVMGRNIRFLRSDLETFRGSFKQEVEKYGHLLLGRQEIPEDCRQLFGETARFGDGF